MHKNINSPKQDEECRIHEDMFWKFKQQQFHTCYMEKVVCESGLEGRVKNRKEETASPEAQG